MKVLITGANGGIGAALVQVLQKDHEVFAHGSQSLNVLDSNAINQALDACKPDAVINCAAYTAVDLAQSEPDAAHALNTDAPRNLAQACERLKAHLIHYSTDYVFNGQKPLPQGYIETDPIDPVSEYGKSKAAGEKAIAETFDRFTILRTSWIYSRHQPCFLRSIYKKWQSDHDSPLTIVNDQHGSPTSNDNIARQTLAVLEQAPLGVFHASSHGHTTWFDFANYFFAAIGQQALIQPCTSNHYPTPAKRPTNSILTNQALTELGLDCMEPWQEDLGKFLSTNGEKFFI